MKLLCCFILFCPLLWAQTVAVKVVDQQGKPVADAAVYVDEHSPLPQDKSVIIDQVDKEFIPFVTVVQRGTAINFPNNDKIRHQVYSFSKTKQFEIPLYKGNPLRPVVFDKAGAVPMACNIHDWMKAYVFVVETDKFALSNKRGELQLPVPKKGDFTLRVWHPSIDQTSAEQKLTVSVQSLSSPIIMHINTKRMFRAWRAPRAGFGRRY